MKAMHSSRVPMDRCTCRQASLYPFRARCDRFIKRCLPGLDSDAISDDDRIKLATVLESFTSFDKNGDGAIDRDELRDCLQSFKGGASDPVFAKHWLPEAELDRVMEVYDKNGNGTIEFDEFKSIVIDGLLLDGAIADYERAFHAVDKSGNGSIGASELMQLLKDLGNDVTYEKLVEVMQCYDKDESGQIEFGEFLLMFRDKLLHLQDIQNYLSNLPPYPLTGPSGRLLDVQEGNIHLVFSEKELEEALRQGDKLTALLCATTWCRPCKALQRPLERLAQHYKDAFNFIKLYGNANEQMKALFKDKLQVRSTPCFIVYRGTEPVRAMTGSSKDKIEDLSRSQLERS